MKILYSIPSYHPEYGGPFFSVGALAAAMARRGHQVGLVASDYASLPVQSPPEGVELYPLKAFRVPVLRNSINPKGKEFLTDICESFRPEVIHDNGMWLTQNHLVAQVARERCIPRVHSPRGCLDPWALAYRGWKKKLAWATYQARDLKSVDCFHAASEQEAENIRSQKRNAQVTVIPNGIEVPGASAGSPPIGGPYALFMGRLDPVKNLATLIRAWGKTRPGDWTLVLAGPDVQGHRNELEALVQEHDLEGRVLFPGPVYGDAKWAWITGASLGVLISHSENFGISLAETLACGVPAIASTATPWGVLREKEIGWWVEGTDLAVAGVLQDATTRGETALNEMGQRAAAYAKEAFGWDRISERMLQVYQEVANGKSL